MIKKQHLDRPPNESYKSRVKIELRYGGSIDNSDFDFDETIAEIQLPRAWRERFQLLLIGYEV